MVLRALNLCLKSVCGYAEIISFSGGNLQRSSHQRSDVFRRRQSTVAADHSFAPYTSFRGQITHLKSGVMAFGWPDNGTEARIACLLSRCGRWWSWRRRCQRSVPSRNLNCTQEYMCVQAVYEPLLSAILVTYLRSCYVHCNNKIRFKRALLLYRLSDSNVSGIGLAKSSSGTHRKKSVLRLFFLIVHAPSSLNGNEACYGPDTPTACRYSIGIVHARRRESNVLRCAQDGQQVLVRRTLQYTILEI